MEKKVLVETSARHVHLTEEAIAALFGADAKLTPKKDLSQPGQFACEERVHVVGPKGTIKNVIILGPARPDCQIEVSLTDARVLGVPGVIRESGDVAGTPGCKLVSALGEVAEYLESCEGEESQAARSSLYSAIEIITKRLT